MTTKTFYEPTAGMIEESKFVPFVASEHFDEWEMLEADYTKRLAKRQARYEAAETERVALVQKSIESVRKNGRTETFGHPTGYAYRMGQAGRRAGNR